jgi:hypothetical protein
VLDIRKGIGGGDTILSDDILARREYLSGHFV